MKIKTNSKTNKYGQVHSVTFSSNHANEVFGLLQILRDSIDDAIEKLEPVNVYEKAGISEEQLINAQKFLAGRE